MRIISTDRSKVELNLIRKNLVCGDWVQEIIILKTIV